MKKTSLYIILIIILTFIGTENSFSQQLAFPEAEGYGRFATGGRGGEVYIVTNLNDAGPGSFRDAVSRPNRIVVFEVGGVIHIESRIVIHSNVYVAGQTAPGDGITIYGNGIAFNNSSGNSIIRYIRIRMGRNGDSGKDAVGISAGQNYIFDHVSVSWGRDGTFDVNGSGIDNITLQNCIIAQGINNQNHSTGGLMQSGKWSIVRSLYHSNKTRNPKARGEHEFINSVLYNWNTNGYIMGDTQGRSECNMIGNYFIFGPSSNANSHITNTTPTFHVYAHDNWVDANKDGVLNGTPLTDYKTATVVNSRFSHPVVNNILPAHDALNHVIDHVGASIVRDEVDKLLINQLTSYGTSGRIINTENDNNIPGNVGTVANGTPPLDTDRDGMPDEWEIARGLNPFVNDASGDDDGDGYTNIEEYLSCLVGESDDCTSQFEDPASLTKHGAGSSSQTLVVSQSIQSFYFTWQNATSVSVTGLPTGINAIIDNTTNRITLSGAPSVFGIFDYTVSTVGGSPNAIQTGTFTISSNQPAIITKHGAGSSSQTIDIDQAIVDFHFSWQNAITVNIIGLPIGINTVIDNVSRTISFSGTPTESGVFTYTITTQGGNLNTERSGTFTVIDPFQRDCNNDINGTAYLDNCGICVSGNTGFAPCVGTMELEDACDIEGVMLESINGGFSGAGYVNTTNITGAYVSWYMNSDAEQEATFTFRYANGGNDARNGNIIINGTTAGQLINPSTGTWTNWELLTTVLPLTQGLNEIVLEATSDGGLANLDLIHFSTGVNTTSCTITSFDHSEESSLHIFPNPTSGIIHLNKEHHWVLTNSYGQILTGNKANFVDLSVYPAGCYFIQFDNKVYKILKQ